MLVLNKEELNLVRQWFDATQDCAPKYIEPSDQALMDKIKTALAEPDEGRRPIDLTDAELLTAVAKRYASDPLAIEAPMRLKHRALCYPGLNIFTDEQQRKFFAQDALHNETMKTP